MVSLSISKQYEAIGEYFCSLIKLAGFDDINIIKPSTVEKPEAERIKEAINNSDVVISIQTKKHKLEEVEDNQYLPSSWLIDEIGRAAQAGKPIGAFIEEGITDLDHLIKVLQGDYLLFNRNNNPYIEPDKVINYLRTLRQKAVSLKEETFKKLPYELIKITRNVAIRNMDKKSYLF